MTIWFYPRNGFAKLLILPHESYYALVLFLEYVSFLGNFLEVCVFSPFSEAVASTISIAVIDGSYRDKSAFVLHNM